MHLKGAPIGLALAIPSNSKTRLERVSEDKPSSLLGLAVSDERNKFYNIDTRSGQWEEIRRKCDDEAHQVNLKLFNQGILKEEVSLYH